MRAQGDPRTDNEPAPEADWLRVEQVLAPTDKRPRYESGVIYSLSDNPPGAHFHKDYAGGVSHSDRYWRKWVRWPEPER